MPSPDPLARPCAFLTCSARARATLEPVLSAAEHLLMDLGWRTRLAPRRQPGRTELAERRRLRERAYAEIERADLVLHVPAPARLTGARMHRELNRAVRRKRHLVVFLGDELRAAHDIEPATGERLLDLETVTVHPSLATLDELKRYLLSWPSTAHAG